MVTQTLGMGAQTLHGRQRQVRLCDCDASETLSQKNNKTKQRENKEGRKSPTLVRNSKFSTSAGHRHKSLELFYNLTHYQSSIKRKNLER